MSCLLKQGGSALRFIGVSGVRVTSVVAIGKAQPGKSEYLPKVCHCNSLPSLQAAALRGLLLSARPHHQNSLLLL